LFDFVKKKTKSFFIRKT